MICISDQQKQEACKALVNRKVLPPLDSTGLDGNVTSLPPPVVLLCNLAGASGCNSPLDYIILVSCISDIMYYI